MAKSTDRQITDAMARKVVGQTTEIDKAVVLELYRRITANRLQVGLAYGSPVLTGRYSASHTVARGRIDTAVREPNPEGEENPYPGLPLTNAAAALTDFKLGETTSIANSLPDAQAREDGHSTFKAAVKAWPVVVKARASSSTASRMPQTCPWLPHHCTIGHPTSGC